MDDTLRYSRIARIIVATLACLIAVATVSAQAALSTRNENWRPAGTTVSFTLGDRGCGEGWHQALWRDWRDDWWWGPCVLNR